jgi:hypothetical protein
MGLELLFRTRLYPPEKAASIPGLNVDDPWPLGGGLR